MLAAALLAFVGALLIDGTAHAQVRCTGPDPFASLGGGTCYNGGWFPPGMPIPRGRGATSPKSAVAGRIDYIFYSKDASQLVLTSSKVYDTRDASGYMPSDHRPVVSTFEVR